MPYHHYFPEAFIALQQELKNHPEILARLEHCSDNAEAYGEIAAALGILLDGWYDPIDLADMLVRKLKNKGALIVVPGALPNKQDERMIRVRVVETQDSITVDPVVPEGKSKEPQ